MKEGLDGRASLSCSPYSEIGVMGEKVCIACGNGGFVSPILVVKKRRIVYVCDGCVNEAVNPREEVFF